MAPDCKSGLFGVRGFESHSTHKETEVVTLPYRHSESRAHAKLSTQEPTGEGIIRKLNRRVRFFTRHRGRVVNCASLIRKSR